MNTSQYAYDNNFQVGFHTNKETKLYEWYCKCLTCNVQESLPKYTKTAYELGLWPYEGERDSSEIWEFFGKHGHGREL